MACNVLRKYVASKGCSAITLAFCASNQMTSRIMSIFHYFRNIPTGMYYEDATICDHCRIIALRCVREIRTERATGAIVVRKKILWGF